MSTKQHVPETEVIAEWKSMLNVFNDLSQKPTGYLKDAEELKKLAIVSGKLTGRQVEGIVDRCNSLINGSYGETKKGVEFKQA